MTSSDPNRTGSFSIAAQGLNNMTFLSIDATEDDCLVGRLCVFQNKSIGLTLDDFLRDIIQPDVTLNNQPFIVQMSAALTLIMFVGGLINGVLSFITFQDVKLRNTACGMYLLASTITSIGALCMFTVKFWFFVVTHMSVSMNVSIMFKGCKSIEPILKVFLYLDGWFNACVAIERAINVSKGVNYNRTKSRRIARWIIMILPICVMVSISHEPVKRDVFAFETDRNETIRMNQTITNSKENLVYCITRYSPSLETYNTVILFFHLLAPFLINFFSALYIIFGVARQRSAVQPGRTYQKHVYEQFNENKHLLISPLVLVILGPPRLIIALLPGCINVSKNPWLYLSAYFISFIPSMLIFIIFVLPSSLYKENFKNTLKTWQRRFRRQ